MNKKFVIMKKEGVVTCFNVRTQNLDAKIKQNLYQNSDPWSKFRTRQLPSTTHWRSVSKYGLPDRWIGDWEHSLDINAGYTDVTIFRELVLKSEQ